MCLPKSAGGDQMSGYVYIKTEKSHSEGGEYYPGLWTVGFFTPEGRFEPESDHGSAEKAAERVHYLNGGGK
jgi:hypothetical protein